MSPRALGAGEAPSHDPERGGRPPSRATRHPTDRYSLPHHHQNVSQSREKNFASVVASGVTSLAAATTAVSVSFVDAPPAVSVVDAAKAPGYRGSTATSVVSAATLGGGASGGSPSGSGSGAGGIVAPAVVPSVPPPPAVSPGSPATGGSPQQQLSPPGETND